MTTAAIEVTELWKTYRNGLLRSRFDALRGVTLQVQRGEIFGLLGPNGAGKTTLIKILLGIARKTSGTAMLLGRPAGDLASRVRVGYLPENLRVAAHHSPRTALELYGRLSGLSAGHVRAKREVLLETVGLADRARDSVRKFSKGMLQRLGLAQALLHDPELLILDEPTDGLDPLGRSQIRTLLNQLKQQGKTVFLNSHILQEVELICDRVAILDRGVLRAIGTVEEIAPPEQAGVELELVVSGPQTAVQNALGERGVSSWQTNADGQHHLLLRLLDQAAVDECVDDMRRQGVSVIGLARRRVTLEDAFLRLLSSQHQTHSA